MISPEYSFNELETYLPVIHKNQDACDPFFRGKILILEFGLRFHRSALPIFGSGIGDKPFCASKAFFSNAQSVRLEIRLQSSADAFPAKAFPIRCFWRQKVDLFSTQFGGMATIYDLISEIWRSKFFLYCWCLWEGYLAALLDVNFQAYASNFCFGVITDLEDNSSSQAQFYLVWKHKNGRTLYYFFFLAIWIGN